MALSEIERQVLIAISIAGDDGYNGGLSDQLSSFFADTNMTPQQIVQWTNHYLESAAKAAVLIIQKNEHLLFEHNRACV